MESTLDNSNGDAVWGQVGPLLEEAMSRLNQKERTLLALRFFENRGGAETAAILGIGEWAARKRAERALEKLRSYFAKRGVDSTTAAIAETISANSVQAAPVALAKTVTAVALAKGATASISTLTLIKGALKIMAWTKAKTAIVVSVGILLTAGTTTVIVKDFGHPNVSKESPAATAPGAASAASPVAQAAMSAWQQGDKSKAVSLFLAADWSARPLFAADSLLSLNESQFQALSNADRAAQSGQMTTQLNSLKQLAAAVTQAGLDAAAKGGVAEAGKYFAALKSCGTALDGPECLSLVQLVGQALKKRADTELAKIGQ